MNVGWMMNWVRGAGQLIRSLGQGSAGRAEAATGCRRWELDMALAWRLVCLDELQLVVSMGRRALLLERGNSNISVQI